MTTFAVTYAYDDRSALRDEVRPQHRAFLAGLQSAGVLLASGPVSGNGASGALLIMTGRDADAVLAMLDADPFWTAGTVAERAAVEWNVVIGSVG